VGGLLLQAFSFSGKVRRIRKMSIRMLGIDHNLAPVDVRAVFAFTRKSAVAAMEIWKKEAKMDGCVILSTCNRMEVWVSVPDGWEGSLLEELCRIKGVDPTEFGGYFVEREGDEAVSHLFHLTCGLKSMILAEDQIISQVRDAHALARENYATDSVLEVLFRKAVTAAKKVKTDVVFTRASETAMDRAVAMLEQQGFILRGKKCMVIGNGEMGKLAALTLAGKGADVTVTVRQYRSGVVQIPRGCSRIDYGERMELFPECDLVVSATASPNYTIRRELLENCPVRRPVILIDLAVPRDIEPEIGELPLITLYDIDDFRTESDSENKAAYEQAEYILREEMEEFYGWLNGRDLIPRIQTIQQDAVTDLNLRIRKIIHKLPMEDAEQQKLLKSIDTAAGKVVGKMMFGLRDFLEKDSFMACMDGLEKLYETGE
jgi:glutamyl-tRNA reductase